MNIAFILETALIILLVFLIGAILGYLIRFWFFKPQAVVAPSSTPAKPVAKSAPVAARSAAPPPTPEKTPEKPAEQPPEPLPVASAPAEVKTAKKSPEVSEPEPQVEPEIVSEGEKESEPSSATKLATPPAPKAAETLADDAGKGDSSGKPVGLLEPRNGQKDDLKRIKGIGPKIEATLNELGIFHFDQIAEWSPASIDWVNGFLSFKGRIQRENWIEQSKALASGGETEFSKRVDKGDVPSSKK